MPLQREPSPTNYEDALERFTPTTAELLAQRSLQKRVDAKFIISQQLLCPLLAALEGDFQIVLSNGRRFGTYETLYFDTADYRFFHAHRRGRRPRHKVRIRHYAERDISFLETKTKDRYGVTTKRRFARDSRDFDIRSDDLGAIEEAIGPVAALQNVVWLYFPRITLVGVAHPERLTIDVGLRVENDRHVVAFDDAAVIEIKQARYDACSPGRRALKALGIRSYAISKYCVAVSTTGSVQQTHRFRPMIRELTRRSHA